MFNYPCKNCVPPKRHRACWDKCEEYQKTKNLDEEEKKRKNDAVAYFKDKELCYIRKYGRF